MGEVTPITGRFAMTPWADLPPLVTVPEAAPHVRTSEWSIYQQIRAGTFPIPVIRVGRKVFLRRSDLAELLGVADDA